MALALTRPRHLTRRAAATGLAALLLTGLTATGALAATAAPTVVLDAPTSHVYGLVSSSTYPAADVPVGYGGTVTVELPAGGHLTLGTPLSASLHVPAFGGSFSTDDGDLTLTDLGGGRYEVGVPDTTAFGTTAPVDALLQIWPLETDVPGGDTEDGAAEVGLAITDGGPATADVDLVLALEATVAGPSVTSGTAVDVAVPSGSTLDQLGLTSLAGAEFTLYLSSEESEGLAPPVPLAAPTLSADGRTATVTVPAGTPAGGYTLAVDAATSQLVVHVNITFLTVTAPAAAPVAAAPVAPAPVAAAPVRNAGLRSATGWEDHVAAPADQDGTPWLALGGAAALLTAGAVTTATLRRRPTA